MGIQKHTPHLFRALIGEVSSSQHAPEENGADCTNTDATQELGTLPMPLPHRDVAAAMMPCLPRQRDGATLSANLEMSCYPNYHIACSGGAISGANPGVRRAHLALLEASEELRLRCLAVAFAEVCDKSTVERMDEEGEPKRKPVPFPKWLFHQGREGSNAMPHLMRRVRGEAVRVIEAAGAIDVMRLVSVVDGS
jgi:hypothetical protein